MKRTLLLLIAALMLLTTGNVAFCAPTSSCPDPTMCFSNRSHSQAPISVTGRVITCVRASLDSMFNTSCHVDETSSSDIMKNIRTGLKQAVLASLALFVVLLGMKVVTYGEVNKKEFFGAIVKFGFVLWFAIGNGLNEWVYEGGRAVMDGLSNFIMMPSETNSFCHYDASTYDEGYGYLALWDAIDCRLCHYLLVGITDSAEGGLGVVAAGALSAATLGVVGIIMPLIFSLELILGIFVLIFAIFVLSLCANFLHFFILAMIGLALMSYLGVIFVPMILFSFTRTFFDNWWKCALSCVLQPVIMTAFVAFPFLVFENILYEGCTLVYQPPRAAIPAIPASITPPTPETPAVPAQNALWVVDGEHCKTGTEVSDCNAEQKKCKNSLGHMLNKQLLSGKFVKTVSVFFFDWDVVTQDSQELVPFFMAILKMVFFCYLFLILAQKGGDLAAQIVGGPNIGKFAMNAAQVLNAFIQKIMEKPDNKKGSSGGEDSKASESNKPKASEKK